MVPPLPPLVFPFLTSNLAIVPLLVIVLLTPSFVLEVIVPMFPLASFLIPLLIVFDEARVIFEIVPPEAFVIPFVMVLVLFRVIFWSFHALVMKPMLPA